MSPDSESVPILKLLDDSDEVYRTIQPELIRRGVAIVPRLRDIAANGSALEAARAQETLQKIACDASRKRLGEIMESKESEIDLERSVFAVALSGYPELDPRPYAELLDLFAFELNSRIDLEAPAEEILSMFGKYVAQEKRFSVNTESFHDPDNNYFNKVLERRKGLPVSVSLVYLFLGTRLNLPVEGIALPSSFLVRLRLDDRESFIDPYEGGRALTREACMEKFARAGQPIPEELFVPASPAQMLSRMLNNLAAAYREHREEAYAAHFETLCDLLNGQ